MIVTKLFNTNVLIGWMKIMLGVFNARIHKIVIKTIMIIMVDTTLHARMSMLEHNVLQMMTVTQNIDAQIGSWVRKPVVNFVLPIDVARNTTTQTTKLNII